MAGDFSVYRECQHLPLSGWASPRPPATRTFRLPTEPEDDDEQTTAHSSPSDNIPPPQTDGTTPTLAFA